MKKRTIKREEQPDIVKHCGNLWRDGFQITRFYKQAPRYFIYEGKKRIGEMVISTA